VGVVGLLPQQIRYGHLLNALTPLTIEPEPSPNPQKFTPPVSFEMGLGLLLSAQIIFSLTANRFDIAFGQMPALVFSLLSVGLLLFFRRQRTISQAIEQLIPKLMGSLILLLVPLLILNSFAPLFGFEFNPAPWQANLLIPLSWLIGGLLGWRVWDRAGIIIGLLWAGVMLALGVREELGRAEVIWLLAFLLAGGGRSLSRLWPRPGNLLSFSRAYPYRRWYFWWSRPPLLTEVAQALHNQAIEPDWQIAFQQLETELNHLKGPPALIADLTSPDWMKRFVAPHVLVRLGSEPVELLLALVNQAGPAMQRTARRILDTISHDTTRRLGPRAAHLLCIDCLSFCAEYTEQVAKKSLTYYGCRTCGQSWEFLVAPQQAVIAVLDAPWTEPYAEADEGLRVNYLQQNRLFDFTAVEIKQASDEQIERFAVRVGNDTDLLRRERYPSMRCIIDGPLSPNSLRILERTFGAVIQF
jgi:hypothetical protein